jgi:endonuclease/exonuclease/phosphatase family metal-dependent hydrolase
MCHVKSLLNDGQDERDHHLREISVVLRKAINPWERLLVIGDMNANPWDRAMVSRRGLHGHQTAVEASQPSTHYKQDYPRLLNLTYQLAKPLAISGSEVWGTFKHKEKKLDGTLRWHLLDQALVSADLAHAAVRSMTGTTSKPWLDGLGISGKRRTWPDHLPILVEF